MQMRVQEAAEIKPNNRVLNNSCNQRIQKSTVLTLSSSNQFTLSRLHIICTVLINVKGTLSSVRNVFTGFLDFALQCHINVTLNYIARITSYIVSKYIYILTNC